MIESRRRAVSVVCRSRLRLSGEGKGHKVILHVLFQLLSHIIVSIIFYQVGEWQNMDESVVKSVFACSLESLESLKSDSLIGLFAWLFSFSFLLPNLDAKSILLCVRPFL